MKKVLLVLAVAAIGIVSCKKDDSVKPNKAASVMGGKGTMTEMD